MNEASVAHPSTRRSTFSHPALAFERMNMHNDQVLIRRLDWGLHTPRNVTGPHNNVNAGLVQEATSPNPADREKRLWFVPIINQSRLATTFHS
jgi:hypothetical protein